MSANTLTPGTQAVKNLKQDLFESPIQSIDPSEKQILIFKLKEPLSAKHMDIVQTQMDLAFKDFKNISVMILTSMFDNIIVKTIKDPD